MGKMLLAVLGLVAVLWVAAVVAPKGGASTSGNATFDAPASPPRPTVVPEMPAARVLLTDLKWRKDGFGNVAIVSFKLVNANAYAVKDFEVVCSFTGKSGTIVSAKQKIIYDVAKANKTIEVRELNVGLIERQAQGATCSVLVAQMA